MKIKNLLYFLIILLILNTSNAQNLCGTQDNPCRDTWDNFDYNNPNADISQIPSDKINIDMVIFNGRGNELTVEQIQANLDKIPDLKFVDKAKAEEAIRRSTGHVVDIGKGASLRYGVLAATYGNMGWVPISKVSKETLVRIDENGNIVLVGEKRLPNEGTYTAFYISTNTVLTPKGEQIDIQGRLSFSDGNLFVKQGDIAIINNLEIQAKEKNVGLNILKDGNGVFFSANTVKISGDGYNVRFLPNNAYVNVKEEEKDSFLISPHNGATVTVESRSSQKKPPLLVVTGHLDKELWANLKNGIYNIDFGSKGVMNIDVDGFLRSVVGSTPVEMQVLNEKNENLILDKDGKPVKLVINNNNELGAFDANAQFDEKGDISCSSSSSVTGGAIKDITGEGIVGLYGKTCDLITGFFGAKIPTEQENKLLKDAIERKLGVTINIGSGLSASQTDYALKLLDSALSVYDTNFLKKIPRINIDEGYFLKAGEVRTVLRGGRIISQDLNIYYEFLPILGAEAFHHEIYHALERKRDATDFTAIIKNPDGTTGTETRFVYSPYNVDFAGDYSEYMKLVARAKIGTNNFDDEALRQANGYYIDNFRKFYQDWVNTNPQGTKAYYSEGNIGSASGFGPLIASIEDLKENLGIKSSGFIRGYGKGNPEEDRATIFAYIATHSLEDIKKLSAEDPVLKKKFDIMGKVYIKISGMGENNPWYNYFYGQK